VQKYGKVRRYHGSAVGGEMTSPQDRFNAEIFKNQNWGVNPPNRPPKVVEKVPKKPIGNDLRELFGDILKKPKDVPFMSKQELWDQSGASLKKPRDRPFIERVEKKSRMPPPPYGFTMINALPDLLSLPADQSSHLYSLKEP
jgi:hypothetical protein